MRYTNADGQEYRTTSCTLPVRLHDAAKTRGWKFSQMLREKIEEKLDKEGRALCQSR